MCWLGLHKWTKWSNYMYGKTYRRVCKKCGKIEIKDFL